MLKHLALSLTVASGLCLFIWAWWERSPLPPSDVIEQPVAKRAVPDGYERGRVLGESEVKVGSDEPTKGESLAEAHPRPFALDAASEIPDEARAGNPDAQFELARALEYCRTYISFFGRDRRRRTLDQGLDLAARTPGASVDEARQVYERCQPFMEGNNKEFGTADEWLERAAAAGHRGAQLLRAERLLIQAEIRGLEQETANSTSKEIESQRSAAKAVLLEGLKRRDPAVLWKIGDLQKPLTGDIVKAEKNQWVWRLAACKSGYDCSQSAEWYQYFCRFDDNCQPYESGIELIQRANAGRSAEIDLLANELLDKINAGDLSDIDWR